MNDKNTVQKRQTARWAEIGEFAGGIFIKSEAGSSYKTRGGYFLSRVNVFGVVLSKESTEFVANVFIEDGTGNISIKSFEKKEIFEGIEVGDIINVIGRVRVYNQTPFISAELVKKIGREAFALRKKELSLVKKFYGLGKEEEPATEEEVVVSSESEKILGLIRSLDGGNGVDMELLAKKCSIKNLNDITKELIRNGEVFEIMPGKLKVLD